MASRRTLSPPSVQSAMLSDRGLVRLILPHPPSTSSGVSPLLCGAGMQVYGCTASQPYPLNWTVFCSQPFFLSFLFCFGLLLLFIFCFFVFCYFFVFVVFCLFVCFFFFVFFVCLFVSASPTISGKKIGIKKKLHSYQVKKLKKKKKKKSRVYSTSDAMGRTYSGSLRTVV